MNKNKTPESYEVLLKNIKEILGETPDNSLLILENSAGDKIGQKLEELGGIISDIGNPRLRICLDTCHLHAAGYDLSTPQKLDVFLQEFDKLIGLSRLEVWHLNDSRDEFASSRDRHENIGEGKVGAETLKLILNHPKLCNLSFILEVPGVEGDGPDKENIERVKGLIK
jgi:deoxyribonuclease-4